MGHCSWDTHLYLYWGKGSLFGKAGKHFYTTKESLVVVTGHSCKNPESSTLIFTLSASYAVEAWALYSTDQDVELVHGNQHSPSPSGNTWWKGGKYRGQLSSFSHSANSSLQWKLPALSLALPQTVGMTAAVPAQTERLLQHKHLDNRQHHFRPEQI